MEICNTCGKVAKFSKNRPFIFCPCLDRLSELAIVFIGIINLLATFIRYNKNKYILRIFIDYAVSVPVGISYIFRNLGIPTG